MSAMTGQQLGKLIFKDGDATGLQVGDALAVNVNARDGVAKLGETDGGYESDIAGADDRDGQRWIDGRMRIHERAFLNIALPDETPMSSCRNTVARCTPQG